MLYLKDFKQIHFIKVDTNKFFAKKSPEFVKK